MTKFFSASSIKELEAATTGGSLTLTGDAGSKATVEVYASRSNWSAEKIKQTLEDNYTIDIRVENLRFTLPAGKGFNLNVKANRIETSGLKNFRGSTESKHIEGTIGIGGPEINVRSSQRVSLSFE